jgi:hypothetical protein
VPTNPKHLNFCRICLPKKTKSEWGFQNELNWSSNVFESILNWVWIPLMSFALYLACLWCFPPILQKQLVGRGGPPGEMLSFFAWLVHLLSFRWNWVRVEFDFKFIRSQAQQNGNHCPPTQTTYISLGFAYSKKRNQTWSFQNDLNWNSNVFESSFDRVWIEFELIFELSSNWVWILFLSFALNSMTRL